MKPLYPGGDDFVLRPELPRVWRWREDTRITIRERRSQSGGIGYRVTFPRKVTGGVVLLVQRATLEAAKSLAVAKGREFRECRFAAFQLTEAAKLQAAEALKMLHENGEPRGLADVVREYCTAKRNVAAAGLDLVQATELVADSAPSVRRIGKPWREVIEYAAARMCPPGGVRTLAEVAEEMIRAKRSLLQDGSLRPASLRDFETRSGRISNEIGSLPMPDVTKDILVQWLHGLRLRKLARRTRKNYRMVLGELLRYAVQKRYLKENPLDELPDIERKEIEGPDEERGEPSVLSPQQAERLLAAAFEHRDLDLGAAIVLGLFGGIRTEELKRLRWDAVRFGEPQPFVAIDKTIAKKRRIRNVPLPDCAVAWLRQWPRAGKEMVTRSTHANDFQKRFQKLAMLAGIRWESNAMRHSFGSYHYAKYNDSLETARILGHKANDQVLFDHYRALATKQQGEAYFAIFPSPGAQIVEFSAAGGCV